MLNLSIARLPSRPWPSAKISYIEVMPAPPLEASICRSRSLTPGKHTSAIIELVELVRSSVSTSAFARKEKKGYNPGFKRLFLFMLLGGIPSMARVCDWRRPIFSLSSAGPAVLLFH